MDAGQDHRSGQRNPAREKVLTVDGGDQEPAGGQPAPRVASRRWFANAGAALLLAFSGVVYARIGVAGTFGALTFSSRVIGAVILACALVILGGAISIGLLYGLALAQRDLSPSPANFVGGAVIAGAATSAAVSFLLFLIQAAALNFSAWLALWAVLAVASGLVLSAAIRARLPIPSVKGLVGGLSIGLLLSLGSFVYSDFYLPSAVAPLLTVSVSVGKASVDTTNKTATIPISITIRNQQTVGVFVLASYVDVAGRTFSGISPGSQSAVNQAAEQDQPYRSVGNNYSYELIEENALDGGGNYFLNPNEVFTASDAVTVSEPTPYDAIQVSYRMIIMRDDRFEVSGYSPQYLTGAQAVRQAPGWAEQTAPGGAGVVAWSGHVYADSYLLNLIDQPEQAYVWYQLPQPQSPEPYFPDLNGTIAPPRDLATGPSATGLTPQEVLSRQNLYGLQREGGGEPTTVLPTQLGIPESG
jgi:hypothetical protein